MLDKVHTILDFYDRPRIGVADFQGIPHTYEALWDPKADDYSNYWHLKAISPATFGLVMEDWKILRRWKQAYHARETPISTHPALPEDQTRDKELAILLKDFLEFDLQQSIIVTAKFKRINHQNPGMKDYIVEWITVTDKAVSQLRKTLMPYHLV